MKPGENLNQLNSETQPKDSESNRPVKDLVCGMLVAPQSAAGSHPHGGQTYFFCSAHCLAKFREEPARFIAASLDLPKDTAEESSANAGGYTCPMHPEIRQNKPGS